MHTAFTCTLLASCLLGAGPDPQEGGSYLYQPAYCLDHVLRGPKVPYVAQPGDIVLCTDTLLFWKITFIVAGAGHPHHSGIVFRRPDGSLAVLESGPHDTFFVETVELMEHLRGYEAEGRVWVRRRTVPLTPEQSAALTNFALAQDGKRFALIRLGGQLTPLRSRGPIRTALLGKYQGERDTYMCSELVTTALATVGLIDPHTARPPATYPHELFFDSSPNPYLNKHFKLAPCWEPPARWTSGSCDD
jgi:hypothetical protein